MDETIAQRGVHAFHNLVVHRPPQAGESLRASARVVGAKNLRGGTLVVIRFAPMDRSGVAVPPTDHGAIYRGVELRGAEVAPTTPPPAATAATAGGVRWEAAVEIPLLMAHVYTECARIYNPIHTDTAVALAAGLPPHLPPRNPAAPPGRPPPAGPRPPPDPGPRPRGPGAL